MTTQPYKARRHNARLCIQVDPTKTIYILDGFSRFEGAPLRADGWTWIPGPEGGCWTTENEQSAQKFSALPTLNALTGKRIQAAIFTTAEDSPLFTGTPQNAPASPYQPKAQPDQPAMFDRREYIALKRNARPAANPPPIVGGLFD